jgi:3-isopropylmalate/(R)-2-methylmalate dehydratase small subunit
MSTKGRIWKFGDNINTDLMAPGPYLVGPMSELKKHCMEAIRPEFATTVKPGDTIVAGASFGCGSSREHAPAALKALGIGAIVAESFGRIFFRNAIAIGLPIAVYPDATKNFSEGEELELDLANAKVTNVTRGRAFQAQPLPAEMLDVLSKGGIVPMLEELAKKKK